MKAKFNLYLTTWWKPLGIFLLFYGLSIFGLYHEFYWLWGPFFICFLLHLLINLFSFIALLIAKKIGEAIVSLLIVLPLTTYYLLIMANYRT